MPTRGDPYACSCGEGRLRPAYINGDVPVLACHLCGRYIEPDVAHPGGDDQWRADVLAMCPPGTGDPEEDRAWAPYQAEMVRQLADPLNDRPPETQWPEDFGLTYDDGLTVRANLRQRLLALATEIEES